MMRIWLKPASASPGVPWLMMPLRDVARADAQFSSFATPFAACSARSAKCEEV